MNSTQGLYGFRINDTDYLMLNQVSSEIQGLGNHVFQFLMETIENQQIQQLKENVQKIQWVKLYENITPQQKQELIDFHLQYELSSAMNTQATDWATFFALEQGNLSMYLDGFKYAVNQGYMMLWSETIHYAYIINLDTQHFEIYLGKNFQKIENDENRYSHLQNANMYAGTKRYNQPETHCYGLVLHQKISFNDIEKMIQEQKQQENPKEINLNEITYDKLFYEDEQNE